MTKHIQKCESCKSKIEGEIYHLGFSDMEAVYCDSCPNVLLIKDHMFLENKGVKIPNLKPGNKGWETYDRHLLPFYKKAEEHFPKCSCSGSFKYMAPPRCSKCGDYLFGEGYDNKPVLRNHGYVFVTTGSIAIKNGEITKWRITNH